MWRKGRPRGRLPGAGEGEGGEEREERAMTICKIHVPGDCAGDCEQCRSSVKAVTPAPKMGSRGPCCAHHIPLSRNCDACNVWAGGRAGSGQCTHAATTMDENETWHVYPTYGPEHETDAEDCWCDPEIERMDNGNRLVKHRDVN